MKRFSVCAPVLTALSLVLCTAAWAEGSGEELRDHADRAIKNLKSADSALTNFFEHSAGYVVFPSVTRTGPNLAGPQVRGILYEKGKPAGEAVLTEINVGRLERVNPFHEAIFFETGEALGNFKQGRFVLSTDIKAVAAAEGVALNVRYRRGAAVFTIPKSGLIETVTIGDQKFSYRSLD